MVRRKEGLFPGRFPWIADLFLLLILLGAISALLLWVKAWGIARDQVPDISLEWSALPYYTLLSGMRGLLAYLVSLVLALGLGHWAVHSRKVERTLIPAVDVLQSVPILGFLPAFVWSLNALFPENCWGLEGAALLLLVTSQVWNLILSYYSSLKSLPEVYHELSRVMGFSAFQKWVHVQLPFAAVPLAWNSLLSMAGGWFFLIPCEAFVLGSHTFRLPGLGSYLSVALQEGQVSALWGGMLAMACLIGGLDFLLWKPLLLWTQRFRSEMSLEGDSSGSSLGREEDSWMRAWLRQSHLFSFVSLFLREFFYLRKRRRRYQSPQVSGGGVMRWLQQKGTAPVPTIQREEKKNSSELKSRLGRVLFSILWGALGLLGAGFLLGLLLQAFWQVSGEEWIQLLKDTGATFLRVVGAVGVSTLWTVPLAIWLAQKWERVRRFQPWIQILASFPAPMFYPLLLLFTTSRGISLEVPAFLLMLLGVQWYLLFNVLAGAFHFPAELDAVLKLIRVSRWDRWRVLYLPSLWPSLVAGWMTAFGAAWNTSVIAEFVTLRGEVHRLSGLGADLNGALAEGRQSFFIASLTVMVLVVVLINRWVWVPFLRQVQGRYRREI